MSEEIKIENIGYTANNNPSRATRSGAEFEEAMPSPDWHEEVVSRNADVTRVVKDMQTLIKRSAWQTKELSKRLLDKDIYTTCENIWNFLFLHIKYKEDDAGEEQLRTPALSWHIRTTRGIDCDDFSIFASTILYNLGIPHYLRIARYKEKHFQHVYVVVPQTQKSYITIDAVLDEFDTEKQASELKDFIIMNTTNLNGIDVTVLSGIEDDFFNELSGILSGKDFEPIAELEGLGKTPGEEEELRAVYNHLIRTRELIRKNPDSIKQVQHPETFLQMIDYAIAYWNTDKREEALRILAEKEQELNNLQGFGNMPDDYEEAQLYYGVEGLKGIIGLGKLKNKGGFFSAVKNVVQQVGQGIKTAGQSAKNLAKKLIKYNPASVSIRAGILLAMKTNFLKIAEKIKWGYLTEDEAKTQGLDLAVWKHTNQQLQKIEHLFENVLQGNKENLKKAILTGRAGGLSTLNGVSDTLGLVAATATAASITTAMPFIKKILDLVKNIDIKKLMEKVSAVKLMQGKKKAEIEVENAEKNSAEKSEEENLPAMPETPAEIPGEEGSRNIPSTQRTSGEIKTDEPNPFTKVVDWVKENPGKTALVAGGLILALSSSARKMIGLGAVKKRGKSKKGKAKKHPPKTISGAGKKKAPAKKKSTPKGKGGNTPTVRL